MSQSIFKPNFPETIKLQQEADKATYIIGLDLHKKTTAITIIKKDNNAEKIFQRKRLKNEKLLEVIHKYEGEKIVVAEAAYGWQRMKEALDQFEDITFVTFDTRKTSGWAKMTGIKNDRIDSEVLAYACLNGGINMLAIYQSSKEAQENFKLVGFRNTLIRRRTQIKNQLKALGRDFGPNPYTGKEEDKSVTVKFMEDMLLEELGSINNRIREIERKMEEIVKEDKIMPVLLSICGIGPITAFALRYKIDKISRFKSAKHLASYFGFGIRQRQSGENQRTGRITRDGNKLVRCCLIQGGQYIRNFKKEYVPLYFPKFGQDKLMTDKIHANKVVTAIARKNLTFVYHCWKNGELFDMERYKQRREKQYEQNKKVITTNTDSNNFVADPKSC